MALFFISQSGAIYTITVGCNGSQTHSFSCPCPSCTSWETTVHTSVFFPPISLLTSSSCSVFPSSIIFIIVLSFNVTKCPADLFLYQRFHSQPFHIVSAIDCFCFHEVQSILLYIHIFRAPVLLSICLFIVQNSVSYVRVEYTILINIKLKINNDNSCYFIYRPPITGVLSVWNQRRMLSDRTWRS